MSSKRWYVDKHTYDTIPKKSEQVGGGSKTSDKAGQLKARMRAEDAKRHGSASYSVREGRKR